MVSWNKPIMRAKEKGRGEVLDDVIQNRTRLTIAHCCFGVAAAFLFWSRPGTFSPHLHMVVRTDISPILNTIVAWGPYVISFLVSRRILENRDRNAVLTFILLGIVIFLSSGACYLGVFEYSSELLPISVGVGVTIGLLLAIALCALVWSADSPMK
jgi:hypothetical protein